MKNILIRIMCIQEILTDINFDIKFVFFFKNDVNSILFFWKIKNIFTYLDILL